MNANNEICEITPRVCRQLIHNHDKQVLESVQVFLSLLKWLLFSGTRGHKICQ